MKKVFLEMKTPVPEPFLNKVAGLRPQLYADNRFSLIFLLPSKQHLTGIMLRFSNIRMFAFLPML